MPLLLPSINLSSPSQAWIRAAALSPTLSFQHRCHPQIRTLFPVPEKTRPLPWRDLAASCSSQETRGASSVDRNSEKYASLASSSHRISLPLGRSLPLVMPFVGTQWKLIFKAWLFTIISVFSLLRLIAETGNFDSLFGSGDVHKLVMKCTYMAALLALRSISKFFQQAFLWEAALNMTYDIRRHVFECILQNDSSYFESRNSLPSGDIAYRITAEAEVVGDSLHSLLETLIPSTFQLLAISIKMMMLSRLLSLVTMLAVPCMSLIVAILGERLRSISREGQDNIAKLSAYLNEILLSMLIVKAYAAEDFERSRFERLALADAKARMKKKKMKAFIPEAITAVYATMAFLLFFILIRAMSSGSLSGSEAVSFITSVMLLIDPIQAVGKSYNELKQGEPAIERLFELTHNHKSEKKSCCLVLPHILGDVKFCSVTFKYGDGMPNAITGVTFHIQAGETVALVGPSGGGKTTVAKLLLSLYTPTEGCILIDGRDIRNLNEKFLRKHVTIVPQNVDLLTGTVAENIAYGEIPDMVKIKQAAILANAHHFITRLPKGYHTELTDSASGLSGGQRQRLAIARAMYRQSSILILDEATSALDNISERLVKDALDQCMIGRTVLVIAHRMQTIQQADRIIFLKNGRVLEQGTHSSLIALGGHYAAFYGVKEVPPE